MIIVRGGGDLATGTIYKLYQCGFDVLILECDKPSAIRRNVAFCEAVYEGKKVVEGVECVLVHSVEEVHFIFQQRKIPLLIDPNGTSIDYFHPDVVIDAILAKKNLGTNRNMAPLTIALGPGFEAEKDVDVVVETKRGHQLGRLIYSGCAIENTGIPGMIAEFGKERVIHSPCAGIVHTVKYITDLVEKGDILAYVDEEPVYATMSGLLRGLIRDGYHVSKGFKMADIDPRIDEYDNCFTISDKARCIAGGVVEAILHEKNIFR